MYVMKWSKRETTSYGHALNDGKFVAIDQSSGGYPWPTDTLRGAYLFHDLQEAQDYKTMFPDLDIFKLSYTLEAL